MGRVLVLGNATLDVIQSVERLPRPGETMLSSGLLRCPGGKGLNQAVAAARTGARVVLVAPVGQDAEAAFLAHGLGHEAGLEVAWRITDAATDMSSIWVSGDGENMIVSTAAAAWSIAPDHARSICADLAAADILLMQGNLRADTTMAAAETARRRGARTVLNTAPISWDMQPVIGLFDIVIANEGEAAALAGGDLAAFWPRLRSRGVMMAVVTLGARGARIFGADEDIAIPALRVHAIDTAGAGDVMVGTMVGLLAGGGDKRTAATIAVAAASLSVTRPGTIPSFPTHAEIRGFATLAQPRWTFRSGP